jgi:hypothetical protein
MCSQTKSRIAKLSSVEKREQSMTKVTDSLLLWTLPPHKIFKEAHVSEAGSDLQMKKRLTWWTLDLSILNHWPP